jgi:hypothetical protein
MTIEGTEHLIFKFHDTLEHHESISQQTDQDTRNTPGRNVQPSTLLETSATDGLEYQKKLAHRFAFCTHPLQKFWNSNTIGLPSNQYFNPSLNNNSFYD